MKLNITNTTSYPINKSNIEEVVNFVIYKELGENKDYYLEIIVTSDEKIRELNREYRKIDAPTDVLTFVYGKPVLGEIYISIDTIKKQALIYSHSIEEEFYYILIHGLLHICGYEHLNDDSSDETMFIVQRKYFSDLKGKIL